MCSFCIIKVFSCKVFKVVNFTEQLFKYILVKQCYLYYCFFLYVKGLKMVMWMFGKNKNKKFHKKRFIFAIGELYIWQKKIFLCCVEHGRRYFEACAKPNSFLVNSARELLVCYSGTIQFVQVWNNLRNEHMMTDFNFLVDYPFKSLIVT